MAQKKEPPPWRAGQYTPLLNQLVLALVRSNLTGRALSVFLVIATETWGHPGKWKQYGRPTAPLGTSSIAAKMKASPATVRRGLLELQDKGWLRMVAPAKGRRGTTWQPTLEPPAPPVEFADEEPPAAPEGDCVTISDWLQQKHSERTARALDHGQGRTR